MTYGGGTYGGQSSSTSSDVVLPSADSERKLALRGVDLDRFIRRLRRVADRLRPNSVLHPWAFLAIGAGLGAIPSAISATPSNAKSTWVAVIALLLIGGALYLGGSMIGHTRRSILMEIIDEMEEVKSSFPLEN